MSAIHFKHADRELPLELTMYTAELLEELTGVDVLSDPSGMNKPKNLGAALYALAGGEPEVGMTYADFKRTITPAIIRHNAQLVVNVFLRDAGGAEEPSEGKPRADASPSKT